jgi:hypothetical protein
MSSFSISPAPYAKRRGGPRRWRASSLLVALRALICLPFGA